MPLVAVASTYRNALAALGPAAGKYCRSGFGLHSGQKTVGLRPMAAVRLKCALGHDAALLISVEKFCLEASFKYNGFSPKGPCGMVPDSAQGSLSPPLSLPMVQLGKERIFCLE